MRGGSNRPESKTYRGPPANSHLFTGCPISTSISEHLYMLPLYAALCRAVDVDLAGNLDADLAARPKPSDQSGVRICPNWTRKTDWIQLGDRLRVARHKDGMRGGDHPFPFAKAIDGSTSQCKSSNRSNRARNSMLQLTSGGSNHHGRLT